MLEPAYFAGARGGGTTLVAVQVPPPRPLFNYPLGLSGGTCTATSVVPPLKA